MKKILAVVSLLTVTGFYRAMGQSLELYHANGFATNETVSQNGDVNNDGAVNVGDIMAVINIMAGVTKPSVNVYLSCPDDDHPHLIDLGLPSGMKWACCNVGTLTPEGYGGYYAWGENSEKNVYNWKTYQYGKSETNVDDIGSDIANSIYDMATATWGSPWRMPSEANLRELFDKCSSTWTTQNGVDGRKFTGPNGGTIFLPAAGCCDDVLFHVESAVLYWSSTLHEKNQSRAYYLCFGSGDSNWDHYYRHLGQSVRPVR